MSVHDLLVKMEENSSDADTSGNEDDIDFQLRIMKEHIEELQALGIVVYDLMPSDLKDPSHLSAF